MTYLSILVLKLTEFPVSLEQKKLVINQSKAFLQT